MRKLIFMMLMLLAVCLQTKAVLKEQNLASTLSVLRAELASSFNDQKVSMARYNQFAQMQHKQMIQLMQKSDQISLMLYSQKQDFTFDMTYACHEATDLYKEFNRRRMPYDKILQKVNGEISRYNDLISSLKTIPPRIGDDHAPKPSPNDSARMANQKQQPKQQPFMLDRQGIADRKACLDYAVALRRNLEKMKASVNEDSQHYKMISTKLKTVNDYALKRYSSIQNNIFVNGDDNYFEVLRGFSRYVSNAKADVDEKYTTEKVTLSDGSTRVIHSQWRGPIVMGLITFMLLYIFIAALLSNVLVRWLVPKRYRTEEFMKKKVCLILAAAMIIFAISVMIARTFMNHNFLLMATKLLIEYSWLLGAIFISLLIRLPGDQIRSGFRIYTPIMLMSFIVIAFRIVFIPNNLVQVVFPPILLLFTLWQWIAVGRHNANIPKSDIFYTWISLVLMIASTLVAWYGYTLLSVQMLIWWTFQLTCIQTITCIYDLLALYEERVLSKRIGENMGKQPISVHINILEVIRTRHEKHINKTWGYDLVSMVLVPVLGVFSIFFSIWWAADVFDLTDTVFRIMTVNFLNIPDVVQLSLTKIVTVGSLFFLFRYLNYLFKALYHKYHKSGNTTVNGTPNFTLANNIIAILVWGTYFIFSIKMLKIPSTAISVISAGLATGVGFAMKGLIENFFYGISLMTGRVRVGDFIECDGIRGKVESITYQSTQVATLDGCVIAFLNSSLFSKNFKNITKNHSYELIQVPVGVAYGVNVEEVRQLLIQAVKDQMGKTSSGRNVISPKKPVGVTFSDFGDNSVNLVVTYWALVEEKFGITGRVKEAIYNTLNAHGIEIPFPQRDLYIRSVPKEETPTPALPKGGS